MNDQGSVIKHPGRNVNEWWWWLWWWSKF